MRIAQIGLIKAHLALSCEYFWEYPRRDPQGRKMIQLCEMAIAWLASSSKTKPVAEIVREVGLEPGLPKTRGVVI